jgi:hypothetical protein
MPNTCLRLCVGSNTDSPFSSSWRRSPISVQPGSVSHMFYPPTASFSSLNPADNSSIHSSSKPRLNTPSPLSTLIPLSNSRVDGLVNSGSSIDEKLSDTSCTVTFVTSSAAGAINAGAVAVESDTASSIPAFSSISPHTVPHSSAPSSRAHSPANFDNPKSLLASTRNPSFSQPSTPVFIRDRDSEASSSKPSSYLHPLHMSNSPTIIASVDNCIANSAANFGRNCIKDDIDIVAHAYSSQIPKPAPSWYSSASMPLVTRSLPHFSKEILHAERKFNSSSSNCSFVATSLPAASFSSSVADSHPTSPIHMTSKNQNHQSTRSPPRSSPPTSNFSKLSLETQKVSSSDPITSTKSQQVVRAF